MENNDYVPFGPEWEAEIMKMNKRQIIELYRRACQKHGAASQPGYSLAEVTQVWNAALTVANNECIRISNSYNADDDTYEAHAASECAKGIRRYIGEVFPEVLAQLTPEGKSILERSMPVGVQDERRFTESDMVEFAMTMIGQFRCGNENIWNRDLLRESLNATPR